MDLKCWLIWLALSALVGLFWGGIALLVTSRLIIAGIFFLLGVLAGIGVASLLQMAESEDNDPYHSFT